MEAKLLCVGDMHLGRRPSRIPSGLEIDAAALTPAAAWRRTVELAIAERVDAVLLAGDVVESDNRFFEAYSALERGVRDLASAGIEVIGVAGNHDVEVLPRLADEIDAFHLLGRGGRWETRDITRDGLPSMRVVGWSFPRKHVELSPLESFVVSNDGDAPIVGLLHCDLDARASRYAPVAQRELERHPVDAWLLGHVHKPSLSAGRQPVGYLGSLQGLDPSESGARGPWMLRRASGSPITLEHVALAPLRWEELDVAVDDIEAASDAESRIVRAISALHERLQMASSRSDAVGCRIRLVGRTRFGVELRRFLVPGALDELRPRYEGTVYFVERVTGAIQPAIDLEALARQSDPPGLLARQLVALRNADAEDAASALVRGAAAELRAVADRAPWHALGEVALDEAAVRERLLRVGTRALEDLLAQRRS